MKDDIFLIDTNILVYSYDSSETEKHEICRSLIGKCWKLEASYAITLQNLSEFYVVVTNKIEKPLSNETARKVIKDIIDFNNWQVSGLNEISLISAIDLCKKYQIHYWDALLCAVMKQNQINNIYTENIKDFKKIPWITAVNPMLE